MSGHTNNTNNGHYIIDHAKLAKNWILGGGIAALALIAFLVWADNYLTNSKGEQELTRVLSEIRTAQTSLPSRVTDARQLDK